MGLGGINLQRSTRDILSIFVGLFVSVGTLYASTTAVETRLGRDVAYLNGLGRSPDGERSLTQLLETRFKVTPALIREIHKARFGYGDISVALALASHLRGGITEANVEKIIAMRMNPRLSGWPSIAKSLGIRLQRVVLQIESMRARPVAKSTAAAERPRSYDPVFRLVHGG